MSAAVRVGGTLSPNVLIVGAVAGLGLVLLWNLTDGGKKSPGDVTADAVNGSVRRNNDQVIAASENLPFSPFWWWGKIRGAYNDIGQD